MIDAYRAHLQQTLDSIRAAGTWKAERMIGSPQSAWIQTSDGRRVLNMCANNYLGLADHPEVIAASHAAVEQWGYGLASVRFICGTQTLHRELECDLTGFLGTEDTILYSSCFDANGGLFETILGPEDAVISDELNHASIIDGIRLCKAQRYRYKNRDLADLKARLDEARAAGARFLLIATDGVFSMDGYIAPLAEICELADRYDALVMVDDSHAVGFIGATGRGTPELHGVTQRIDVLTGTLGKALGGASGGYTSGRSEIVQLLRQRSRPYLFSNTLAPVIAGASLKVFALIEQGGELRRRLFENAAHFRAQMKKLGFTLAGADHPIIPVMLGDARLARDMAAAMMERGVYVIGFSFPVVPRGQARIRTQMSAAHTFDHIDEAVAAFTTAGRRLGVIR